MVRDILPINKGLTRRDNMSESAIVKAIESAKSKAVKVEKIELPKPSKSKSKGLVIEPGYYKPTLYIDNKELSNIGDYKAGEKLVLVIECTVKGISIDDRVDSDGKVVKRQSASIEIDSFADITPNGGK